MNQGTVRRFDCRRRFTKEFKLAAVRRLEAGESGSALARELEVKREKLYHWLAQVERYGVEGAFESAQPNQANRVNVPIELFGHALPQR